MKNNSAFNTYFAAANGYLGFRSYFNKIFSPNEYKRIYILKGGPGTGKSSLMKKIKSCFCEMGVEVESILCSSDPESYDGIIIKGENGKFAILDGTAPHETDAKIPGAVDEIVNLGVAWNRDALMNFREEIIMINERKKSHYVKAYKYLKLAGELAPIKAPDCRINFQLCRDFVEQIISDFDNKNQGRIPKIKLISSFGKEGYKTLDQSFFSVKNQISIVGNPADRTAFMDYLKNESIRRNVDFTLFPTPLSDSITEGIYFEENDTFISTAVNSENKVDISGFVSHIENDMCDSKFYDELINSSKEEFLKASRAHFELEAIYTPAMCFDKIDAIRESIIADIKSMI